MITCGALVLVTLWELGASDGGFLPAGTLGQWEHATPPGASEAVWVTRAGADTFHSTTETLTLPLPDTTGLERPVLVLEHAFDLGAGDRAWFEIDRGTGFEPLEPIGGYPGGADAYSGRSNGTVEVGLPLTDSPPGTQVRLVFSADDAGAGPGWTLHDARLMDGDPIPPTLELLDAPVDNQHLEGPHRLAVRVTEDAALVGVRAYVDSGAGEQVLNLVETGGQYEVDLPAVPPDTTVTWRVEAEDCASITPLAGTPFRVFLAAPEGLSGPVDPRTVADAVTLSWLPPSSSWPVLDYRVVDLVRNDWTPVGETYQRVVLEPESEQRYTVEARYDTPWGQIYGDPAEPIELHVEVPEVLGVTPARAFPGENIFVEVEGRSLYLQQGTSIFTGIEDVAVQEVEVRDVDRATLLLSVAPDARPGMRSMDVVGPFGVFRFADVFEIADDALAPAITRVQPSRMVQGQTLEVTFSASRAFEGEVRLLLDDEIVAASEPVVVGGQLVVELAATAGAGVGEHAIVLEDDRRLLATAITVDEYRAPTGRSCGTALVPASSAGLLAAIALFVRRRRSDGVESASTQR